MCKLIQQSPQVKIEDTSKSNSLFPNVTQTNGKIHHIDHIHLNDEASTSSNENPPPISTIINAKYGGNTVINGLVTHCLRQKNGYTYTVLSNDGRNHQFCGSAILSTDFSDVPSDRYPPSYITEDEFKPGTVPERRASPRQTTLNRSPYNHSDDEDDTSQHEASHSRLP